jgi:hypothetical protein
MLMILRLCYILFYDYVQLARSLIEIIVVVQFYRGTDVQFYCKLQELLNRERGKLKIWRDLSRLFE